MPHSLRVIHPTAIIHPGAQIDASAQIGPYSIIESGVQLGPDCVVGPHVLLAGRLIVGARNRFFAGAVIGEEPQDLRYKGEPTGMRVGDGNTFRENAIMHRSTDPSRDTIIGSNNYIMGNVHIGHNCVLGDHIVMVNGALIGGHAQVEDRAFISGNCLVHQFARVGTLAMMQGGSAISKDLPPFTISTGNNGLCGLNSVGLRRAGLTSEERLELKRLYHVLFRSGTLLRQALDEASAQFTSPAALKMIEFARTSKRGLCADVGRGRSMEAAED